MCAKILDIEYYIPEGVLTNNHLEEKFSEYSAQQIEKKVGIKQRHIVSQDETALDLACNAGKKILQNYDKNLIDFVLLCTQSPDYYLPTSACILQDRLGLKTDIGALDFNLGCSGFIYGLGLAKGIINSGIATNILLITSETYSKHIHPKDRSNLSIFGDGAAAIIITKSEKEKIFNFVLGTDGKGYKNLIVPNGGMRCRYQENAEKKVDQSGSIKTDNNLFMDGPEIFNFTIKKVPAVVSNVLEKNNLNLNNIDFVIFHQANSYILEHLRKKIKIPKEKFYINIENTGNTVSATIPIGLKDCLDKKLINKGELILLVGFGVGYSWGGTIIEI
ncbi:MAG: ketoacyl-ACP synthase III [Deltaproteobacteria bacterium]|jgi:3-oxoacyl-[acyl-carrier-protein] synthase-3|nr:ketoacyl-ACP synthase III [Deltaproteobacteria bacterium]